jgi:hypothetical protein
MYSTENDWEGDEGSNNPGVHFRLYLSSKGNVPTVICVQAFDYYDYDARRILSTKSWATDGEAQDALLELIPELNRAKSELDHSNVDYELRPYMFAQMIRQVVTRT